MNTFKTSQDYVKSETFRAAEVDKISGYQPCHLIKSDPDDGDVRNF
jgi:hypothetical protein